MIPKELDQLLEVSLEDEVLSRRERRSIRDYIRSNPITNAQRQELQHRTFSLAQAKVTSDPQRVLGWVQEVMKAVQPPENDYPSAEARFSPGEDCLHTLLHHLNQTRTSADICVFTITDNRLANAIEKLYQRGIHVRIISDNDKSLDRGSDVDKLADIGIKVKYDQTEHHMHHKYALFDNQTLVTGSYNWTRSAALHNHENIVVTSDHRLVTAFTRNFESLWNELPH